MRCFQTRLELEASKRRLIEAIEKHQAHPSAFFIGTMPGLSSLYTRDNDLYAIAAEEGKR
jgi:hypothetical protein